MDHLIAVAQLFGHDAERPGLVLRLLRTEERHLVLLDRTEFRGRLRADLRKEVLRSLGRELLRLQGLRLSEIVTDLDLGRDVLGYLRAEAERLVLWEERRPDLAQLRVVGKVVLPPVLDRLVIAVWQHPDLIAHDI